MRSKMLKKSTTIKKIKNKKKSVTTKTARKGVPYDEWLIERLKDHEFAIAYLNSALEDVLLGEIDSQKVFLMALRNVALAQGGMTKVAKKTRLGRENLYKVLSEKGNPELSTLGAIIQAMGLNL